MLLHRTGHLYRLVLHLVALLCEAISLLRSIALLALVAPKLPFDGADMTA